MEVLCSSTQVYLKQRFHYLGRKFVMTPQTKLLGFDLSCVGGTMQTRDRLLGSLRAVTAQARARFMGSKISGGARAAWAKPRAFGLLGYYEAGLALSVKLSEKLQAVKNGSEFKFEAT